MSAVPARMYTQATVRIFLRPVAFCALLLVGAAPAATLACELACAAPTGHHGHHDTGQSSHHDHSGAAGHDSAAAAGSASVVSLAADCDHVITAAPLITSAAVKIFAPVAAAAEVFVLSAEYRADVIRVRDVAGGPPGTRSGSLPLRI